MVEHQVIYSPERKNNNYIRILRVASFELFINTKKITISSLCWLLILLHHVQNGFLFASSHGFPFSAGFKLTLFTRTGWPGPFSPPSCKPVPGSSGSRQLPASLWGTFMNYIKCNLPESKHMNANDF
jgi:hypothetical protein